MTGQLHASTPHTGPLAAAVGHLVLGTAQLGMPYGVANRTGQPDFDHALELVRQAWSLGLRRFDTAQAYGESETVLGRIFAALGIQGEALVYSKLGAAGPEGAFRVRMGIEASLRRLGVPQLAGLLLHREDDLDGELPAQLADARRAGQILGVGASVYSSAKALQALTMGEMEFVQVAANVFDRRMQRAEVFTRAVALGKTVFIRSVYLQGLILQEPDAVAPGIAGAREGVAAYREFCREHEVDLRRFAFDHVRWMAPHAKLVVGAETVEQVRQNMEICAAPPYDPELHAAWTRTWPEDYAALVDPRHWNTTGQQKIRK